MSNYSDLQQIQIKIIHHIEYYKCAPHLFELFYEETEDDEGFKRCLLEYRIHNPKDYNNFYVAERCIFPHHYMEIAKEINAQIALSRLDTDDTIKKLNF